MDYTKVSTYEGALALVDAEIKKSLEVENINPKADFNRDFNMDSLDVLELLANIEKDYTESASESIFGVGDEWRNITTPDGVARALATFAQKKLERKEKFEIASLVISDQIYNFLERLVKRPVYPYHTFKELGLDQSRMKKWAEKHFRLYLSPEDHKKKIKTVDEFYCMVVRYYDSITL